MSPRTASIIGGLGRFLIGLGVVVILFAGFQLYGTGLLEAQAQNALDDEFDLRLQELEAAGLVVTEDPDEPAPTPPPPTDSDIINAAIAEAFAPELGERDGPEFVVTPIEPDTLSDEEIALLTPDPGEVLGTIEIPDIGLTRNIVAGTRRDDLRKGPGHYSGTPLPGQAGNAAIAGHRTTYGEPFRNLHQLREGDLIKVTTFQGEHYYQVMGHENDEGETVGHFIVNPSQTEVIEDFGDNRLTLTACHPIASSRQRIIVTAQLVSAPQAVLPTVTEPVDPEAGGDADPADADPAGVTETEANAAVGVEEDALEESLGWNWEERPPTLLWGSGALAVVVAAMIAARRWNRWLVYAGATPVFLVALFFCFVHLDRMLPAL